MFSGIVETTARVLQAQERDGVVQIHVERPSSFNELNAGDSIACDGVCLTLEAYTATSLQFALGPETCQITGWAASRVLGKVVNLERSLRLGDRLHGHLVTGHVDASTRVIRTEPQGETLTLTIEIPRNLQAFVWPKGSVAINGVSLTINKVQAGELQVGLIPETLKRTNLGDLTVGTAVCLEVDNLARGLVHLNKMREQGAEL